MQAILLNDKTRLFVSDFGRDWNTPKPCRSKLAREHFQRSAAAIRQLASKLAATGRRPLPFTILQKRLSPAEAGLECQFQVLAEAGAVGAIIAISGESRRLGAAVTVFGKSS